MEYQKGQILLIVVLVMVTALTIGLSVAARSITNIRSSEDASNSEKAFSAAEAGIERALTNNTGSSGSLSNNASYKTNIVTVGGTEFTLNENSPILKDEPADVWLSNYPSYTSPRSGNITVFWGSQSDTCNAIESQNTMAAIEIIVFSGTAANPVMSHYAVDPCAQRRLVNRFQAQSLGQTVAGTTYAYSKSIVVNSGLFVRVIPLYAPTLIGVTGCDGAGANCTTLPVQGTLIQSVGTLGDTQRKIQTYRYYPQLPAEITQYSLFISK